MAKAAPQSPAAVISHRYWQRRFAGNPDVIGKRLTIGNKLLTIVGVTPPRFLGVQPGRTPDLMLPLTPMLSQEEREEPTNNNLNMIARLKPGATVQQVNAEVQVSWDRFIRAVAAPFPEKDRARILQQSAKAEQGRMVRFRQQGHQHLLGVALNQCRFVGDVGRGVGTEGIGQENLDAFVGVGLRGDGGEAVVEQRAGIERGQDDADFGPCLRVWAHGCAAAQCVGGARRAASVECRMQK